MKRSFSRHLIILSVLSLLAAKPLSAAAQGTAFTYQGQLDSGGAAASGSYDMVFTLFATNSGGNAVAGPLTNLATQVSNGTFTLTLDFGAGVFNGSNYWLQIAVQTNQGGDFTPLSPLQQITPTPYAIYAPTAGAAQTAMSAGSFSGNGSGITNLSAAAISGSATLSNLTLTGTVTGNGSGLSNLSAAQLSGSAALSGLTMSGSLALGDNPLYLRQGGDRYHGLAYAGNGVDNFGSFQPDGPVLWGFTGGILGTLTSTQTTAVLSWNTSGVTVTNSLTVDGTLALPQYASIYAGGTSFISASNGNESFGYAAGNPGGVTGIDNTAIGFDSLLRNTSGIYNTAAGVNSLLNNTVGSYNSAFGTAAMQNFSNGSYNTAVGFLAFGFPTNGQYNTAIGFQAMLASSTVYDNTSLGANANGLLQTGSQNTSVGNNAGYNVTTGSNNTALGYDAGFSITTGSSNIDIGNTGTATDTNIIRIGASQTAAYLAGTVYATNFSGNASGLTNLNASQLSGTASLSGLTLSGTLTLPSQANISAGESTLLYLDTDENEFFGIEAGNGEATVGQGNTGIGFDSVYVDTTGAENTATGASSLYANTTGSANAAFGYSALEVNATGSSNTAIGAYALGNSTNGQFNTAVGAEADGQATSGSYNIALGFEAGSNILTGSFNIDIGNLGTSTDANIIRIGTSQSATYLTGVINGNGSGLTNLNFSQLVESNSTTVAVTVTASGNVGIGTNSPNSTLQVNGNVQAQAFVGGSSQTLTVSDGFIGGGLDNTNSSSSGVVAGGTHNSASGGSGAVVGGGGLNEAGNKYATVVGGQQNKASGQWSTVAGGNLNTASGDYSFAAGTFANATYNGTFVWADSTGNGMASTASNQFLILAGGGVGIGTNAPNAQLEVNGTFIADGATTLGSSLTVDTSTLVVDAGNNRVGMGITAPSFPLEVSNAANEVVQIDSSSAVGTWLNMKNSSSGGDTWRFIGTGSANGEGTGKLLIQSAAGGTRVQIDTNGNFGIGYSGATSFTNKLTVNGSIDCTTLYQTSDVNAKENFAPVNARDVLDKVASLPVSTWNYKSEAAAQRHLGPTAQDFKAAFQLGADNRHISTVDEGGVALAAIQGLNEKLKEKDAEIQELKQSVDELKAVVSQLRDGTIRSAQGAGHP